MKQTAVDLLVKHLEGIRIIDGYEWIKLQEAIQQAKAMEKEQIKDAYDIGYNEYDIYRNGQNYYNETFKSE